MCYQWPELRIITTSKDNIVSEIALNFRSFVSQSRVGDSIFWSRKFDQLQDLILQGRGICGYSQLYIREQTQALCGQMRKGLKQLVTHFVFCSLVYNSWAITTTIICRPWLLVCLTSSYFGGYQPAHQLPKILPPTLPVTNLGLTRLWCIINLINLFLGDTNPPSLSSLRPPR